jgi:proline iminopeptidase
MLVSTHEAEIHSVVRGDGPACLVLSIIGTAPYERQLPAALDARLRLVFVDPRGGGRSTGRAADLDFDRLAADLDAVRTALDVDRVLLFGHSIVGMLALEAARRLGERTAGVIAVGLPPHGDVAALGAEGERRFAAEASDERRAILRDNLARLPADTPPAEAMDAQTPLRFFDPRFDARPLFAGAEIRPELFGRVLGELAPGWSAGEALDDLARAGVPVLLAHGRHDYVVPVGFAEELAAGHSGTTLRIFERSGHQPFVEEPESFVAAVAQWLDRERAASR